MFCRFCGQEIPNDSVFCPKCGKRQREDRAEETEKPAPADESADEELDEDEDDLDTIEIWCPHCDEDIDLYKEDRKRGRLKCRGCGKTVYFVVDEDEEDADLVTCPHCGEEFWAGEKLMESGHLRCPRCGEEFDLEDESQDDGWDDEEAKRKKRAAFEALFYENGNENNYRRNIGADIVELVVGPDEALTRVITSTKQMVTVAPGPVTSFKHAGSSILYTTRDGSLYMLAADGRRQKILGGNGDLTAAYCANQKYFFVLLDGKNDVRILYRLDLELKEDPVIIRSKDRIRPTLAADERYLYYIVLTDDINKNSLIQHDLATGSEKVIYNGVGIRDVTAYNSYLVISTYQNWIDTKKGVELRVIDPRRMLSKKLADIDAEQFNCYLDHVFFLDPDKHLWLAPLRGSGAHLIWDKPVAHFEVCGPCVYLWSPNSREPRVLPLYGDNAFQVMGEEETSQEEREALQYNSILHEKPEYYAKMSLSQILDYAMAEYSFEEDTMNYVVFLTKPSFNKRREDVNALLEAAGYPAKRKPGSEPILFVDSSLFHTRSKGFVVATDGIYTKSKGFMLFNHTFTCEEKGLQNLDACLWRNDSYDDHPLRTLKLDLSLNRTGLEEVADLIMLVFAFSYFRRPPRKVDYEFPVPSFAPPDYIPSRKEPAPGGAGAGEEKPSPAPTQGEGAGASGGPTPPAPPDATGQAEKLAQKRAEAQKLAGRLAVGSDYVVGIRPDGTVVARGQNLYGEGDVSRWSHIVALAAANGFTVGLRRDGTVLATGANRSGQLDVKDWRDIVAISAGGGMKGLHRIHHTVGLRRDGTVRAAGNNSFGQCNVDGWSNIVAISAGDAHTVGLRRDGTVVATGKNDGGQCQTEGWTDIVAISAGLSHTVGLRRDGTAVAIGNDYLGECQVSGWTDIVAISAGFYSTVGLRADGTVVIAGRPAAGAGGEPSKESFSTREWRDIACVFAGSRHSAGLTRDGYVCIVGKNVDGILNIQDQRLFDNVQTLELDGQDGPPSP